MASNGTVVDVLSALSHDLRSPTATMMLWLRLLRGAPDDVSLRERGLEAFERSVKSLEKLIADVLALARVEHRHYAFSPRAGQLELAAQAAVRAHHAAAASRSVKLRLSRTTTPGVVRFDPVKLREAMTRMIAAAVEIAAEHSTLDIESSSHVFAVEADVREGVSASVLASALCSFPPQKPDGVAHFHGATLDLAVARSLLRLHGADLAIGAKESQRRIRIELALPPPRTRPPRTSATLEGVRLLIVDDQPTTLEVMSELLRRAGASVTSATNAHEARTVLMSDDIDVIACDLSMPGESGAEFLRERRTQGIMTPAIALTGYTSADEIDNAHDSGFDAYVAKPVEFDALVTLIADLASIRNP